MKIRADVAQMLRDGHTHTEICRRLHVAPLTVQRAREALRLPPAKAGPRSPSTPEAAFHERTEQLSDGHLRWTGHVTPEGTPSVGHQGRGITAYRIAFRIRHGRDPVGRPRPGCGMPQCVAPDHIEDQPMRERNRRTYEAIFGDLA